MATKGYVDAEEWLERRVGKLTFGKMIRCIRECDEIGQSDFAKKLGISKSHLCDIEQDRKSVSPERAARWAKLLGYSEHQFVQLSLQGMVDKGRLGFKVLVEAA
jgi:transcriptional regulator with XRE-family HTH domain